MIGDPAKVIVLNKEMGSDLDWIIISFSIYLGTLWVEKFYELACKAHFSAMSQFGDLGFGTF